MKKPGKKIIKILISFALAMCLNPVGIYAGEELRIEEQPAGSVPFSESLSGIKDGETGDDAGTDENVQHELRQGEITAVDAPERTQIHMEYKPALDVLLDEFPETITIHRGDETETIEAAWVCDGDYNEFLGEYPFVPDLEGYLLADGTELPVIIATFDNEGTGPVGEVSDFDLDYEVPSVTQQSRLRRSISRLTADGDENIPSQYNMYEDGMLPDIRSQGGNGACWAFSAIGAMEADLIQDGKEASTDLSELHLAYYAANNYNDPRICRGDRVDNKGMNWANNGGHFIVAARLLTELVGAVPEDVANYNLDTSFAPDDSFVRSKDTARVRNAYYINPSERDEIKKAIMEHGAVAASYYDTGSSYNGYTNSYYYNMTGHNHAVLFVGWDDDFSADDFTKTKDGKQSGRPKPAGNGAWLVRNSWGDDGYSHSGYFWMSYHDVGWNSTKEVIVFDATDEIYDNCYAYDGYYLSDKNVYVSPKSTATVTFPVSGGEDVEGVAFELATANVTANVTVTNTKTGKSVSKTIKTKYAGIYTAEFDEPLAFSDDADAKVSLDFTSDSGEAVGFVCETPGKETQFGKRSYGMMFYSVCDKGFDIGTTHIASDPRVRLYTNSRSPEVHVESVSTDTSQEMLQGESAALSAEVLPENATYRFVRWSSNNTKVATVSPGGVVTAISPGVSTISVWSTDGGKRATCNVKVVKNPDDPDAQDTPETPETPDIPDKPVAVGSVSLNKTSASVKAGGTIKLTAVVLPENAADKSVIWSTSKKSVATVSASGNVKTLKPGKAVITVTTKDGGKTAKCTVTVKSVKASKIKLSKSKATLRSGKTLKLKAMISPDNTTDKTVKWTTSKKSVATVSSKGVVRAVGRSGTVKITATTANGRKATCRITVKPIKVKKISLKKSKVSVNAGKTVKLKTVISPGDATDKRLIWKSKDKKIAKVSSKGVVKGVKKGKTTITVTTKDGKKTAKCIVTVK